MQPKMGSPFHLVFYSDDSAKAAKLTTAAFAVVDSLNNIFSDYEEASELNRLSQTAGMDSFVAVSAPLYDIIKRSAEAWQQSDGTFDITTGPLNWLWRQSRKQGFFPADSLVQQAKEKTGFQKISIDTGTHKIKLFQNAMRLDLGGMGKGYVAQAVVDFLYRNGITSALVAASGDIVCSGAPPQEGGWRIGVNVPEQQQELLKKTISLHNGAVSTSGDAFQFIEHNGKKFSHIIDPKTGYGVTFQRNVTVIAPDGATADWLATACSILPVRSAKRLVKKYRGALFIGVLKNRKLRFYKTKNWRRYINATS